jgi:hypothetical protein
VPALEMNRQKCLFIGQAVARDMLLKRHSRESGNPFDKIGFRVKPGMTTEEKEFLTHYIS